MRSETFVGVVLVRSCLFRGVKSFGGLSIFGVEMDLRSNFFWGTGLLLGVEFCHGGHLPWEVF